MEQEKLEQFAGHVESLGFIGLPLDRFYGAVRFFNVDGINVQNYRRSFGQDDVRYNLKFVADDQRYPKLTGFEATLRHVPTIEHGIFRGIDTAVLEENMRRINWRRGEKNDPEPNSPPEDGALLSDVFGKLNELSASDNPNVRRLADSLKVKYWSDTQMAIASDLAEIIPQFEKTHFFKVDGKFDDITAKDAYNLLSSRSVMKFEQVSQDNFVAYWLALEPSKQGLQLVRYDAFDLAESVKGLPLLEPSQKGFDLYQSVIEGNPVFAHVLIDGKRVMVSLSADPKNKDVVLRDERGNSLPLEPLRMSQKESKRQKKGTPSGKPRLIKRKPPGKNRGRSM